jgi:hypothetical protein
MTKKKIAPKKSVAKKATVKKVKCCSENPNFLVVLLAASIIAFAFLFKFL